MTQRPSLQLERFAFDELKNDPASLRRSLASSLLFDIGKDPATAMGQDWYQSVARVVRDRLVERWMDTTRAQYTGDVKRVYYLSMEFLVGRALSNSLHALDLYDVLGSELREMGLDLDELRAEEPDAALGNGGLGRLAACFMDSLATEALPSYGYGIRYDYGMFAQRIHDGYQVTKGLKIAEIDPSTRPDNCFTISAKSRCVSGAVLEAILAWERGIRK